MNVIHMLIPMSGLGEVFVTVRTNEWPQPQMYTRHVPFKTVDALVAVVYVPAVRVATLYVRFIAIWDYSY